MKTKKLWKGFLGKAVMAALLMGIASCSLTASPPTEEFLNLTVGVVYSNNGVPNIVKGVTLREFVEGRSGVWEKVNDSQWIFRIKSNDQLTKQNNEVTMLFVRQQIEGNDTVIFQRVILNGQEMSGREKDTVFNQIAYGIMRAKGSVK